MNKNLERLIGKIKETKMTDSEKSVVRHNISFFMENNPIATDKKYAKTSPYFSRLSFPWMKTVSLALVIMVSGGGSLAYASAGAMPGDLLYNAKINFTEELVAMTKISPESKIQWQETRVENRLNEVDTMLKNGTLNEKGSAQVEAGLQKQLDRLSQKMDNLPQNKKISIILKTASMLTPALQAHEEAIRQLSAPSRNTDAIIAQVENGINIMSEKEDAQLARTDAGNDLPMLAKSNIDLAQTKINSLLPEAADSKISARAVPADNNMHNLNSLLAQSKEKINSGDYKGALQLSQQASKMAETIQLKIDIGKNLKTSQDGTDEIGSSTSSAQMQLPDEKAPDQKLIDSIKSIKLKLKR